MVTASEEISSFMDKQIKSLLEDKGRIENNIRIGTITLKEINMKLKIYKNIKKSIKVVK